ncbi:MAG: toxin-antitoxin system HicB family antitoxin [Rhodococcus sp.]|uniref:toxin-antitoxin system HicB family antitoxin n=1 Tax=Rhodococcus TaxID=1827 RepID=UPI0016919EC5|nr:MULTISPECIES: toxin-antitoxin system HicB family antitoxin [Rhodococcus]NLV77978.1 toxin-antitoxin system HicB family antitoxin [Rhodococcus sp. (in: high G+C Gram-positive bacteria)]
MNIDRYIDAITGSVTTAAELGDDETRRIAAALAGAAAAPARLALLGALSDMAAEVSSTLGDRTVTVRLVGDEAVLDVHSGPEPAGGDTPPTFEEMTGDISRVTLRLVEQIKSRAEEAAAQNGVSLNSWVAQAVQGALRDQMRYQQRTAEHWRRTTSRAPEDGAAGTAGTDTPGDDRDEKQD